MNISETKLPREESSSLKRKDEDTSSRGKDAGILIAMLLFAIVLAVTLSYGLDIYLDTDTPQVAVTTGSMEPVYHGYESSGKWEGDLLIVRRFSPDKYQVGDVIIFDAPGQDIPIVHRIVGIYHDTSEGYYYFRTMGDNNVSPDNWPKDSKIRPAALGDGWIHEDAIHGRVVLRIPNFGWLALQLHETYMKLLIAIAAIILLIWGILDRGDEKKRIKPDNSLDSEEISQESSEGLKNHKNNRSEEFSKNSKASVIDERVLDQNHQVHSKKGFHFELRARYLAVLTIAFIIIGYGVVQVAFAFDDTNVELLGLPEEISLNSSGIPNLNSVYEGSGTYFLLCKLRIHSSGLFRSINKVDINLEDSYGTSYSIYKWTIVYGFNGAKSVETALVLALNSTTIGDYTITVIGHTTGILAGSDASATYSISITI